MELRPFRAIRFSPTAMGAAPVHIARIIDPGGDAAAASGQFRQWLADGTLWKERRPGLWLYSQTHDRGGAPLVLRFLIGLVRVDPAGDITLPSDDPEPDAAPARGLPILRELKADFEPALVLTRAPLTAALATTRRPELSLASDGIRHDALRVNDFAEHVELQGLVKSAEATLADGREAWEAAREMARDAAAAKLPGAKYKLCAIIEENAVGGFSEPPRVYAGLWGFSLEDPVY
jgi:Protein of unknown function (DUF1015)